MDAKAKIKAERRTRLPPDIHNKGNSDRQKIREPNFENSMGMERAKKQEPSPPKQH